MAHVVVVGAGITGLSAAWHLLTHGEHRVTVLEGAERVGGRLRTTELAGQCIDVGAESMLARRPEAVDLLAELDLEPVHPAAVGARLWSRGRMSDLPRGTLMGVPARPDDARGVLDDDEVARAAAESPVAVDGDITVGDLVERALGPAVVDRLVEPLLGGVYAGRARELSAAACVPVLLDAVRDGGSLTAAAARAAATSAGRSAAPVFAGLVGGVGTLPELLAERITARGGVVRTGVTVRELQRTAEGWSLVTGPVPRPEVIEADAVVVTTPARPASRLVADVAPRASTLLGEIDYASMAIVSIAFAKAEFASAPTGSGFLVPPVDGRVIKASTFSSVKWPWLAEQAGDLFVLRVSMGRHGEEAVLQREDAELVDLGLRDLDSALRQALPRPVDSHVQRWGGALPQYAVGHLDRVADVEAAVAGVPGLELAGAAFRGVGIPACIGSGRAAAERVLTHLTGLRHGVGE